MAKLVDIYNSDKKPVIKRRQLPLVINENLTMIMDLNSMGLICDNPQVKGREFEEFMRKYKILTPEEVKAALRVTCPEILNVLSQTIPCVGCRRSVERVFYQLMKSGHPTLDPLVVTSDGILTIREDKINQPQLLSTLLHGHSSGLDCLVESQPRSKKSRRCVLHSLEGGRGRTLGWPGAGGNWRAAWDCMRAHCREEVTLVQFQTLQDTLDNYLRKHRFCGECKTKVLWAYQLLVEEKEPQKEKGYVGALYSGIKRCLEEKHLHLQSKTDYITNLIMRAEPELMGNHRERHAKTLEIAQEEVLICLGICVFERLHRISLRLREEEGTCQVLAAVAVEALYRNFETAVEIKSGVSKLELLYEELTQEEAAKQQRKEQKKLKKRKKKERLAIESKCAEFDDTEEKCECEECFLEIAVSPPVQIEDHNSHYDEYAGDIEEGPCQSCQDKNANDRSHSSPRKSTPSPEPKVHKKGSMWSSSDHSQDCGYSSENNTGCCSSSLTSSPEGSEVACSEGFCNHERGDCLGPEREEKLLCKAACAEFTLSLQEMLLGTSSSDDEHDDISYIPIEDVMEFKSRGNTTEKREELRRSLRSKFAQLCVTTPQSSGCCKAKLPQ